MNRLAMVFVVWLAFLGVPASHAQTINVHLQAQPGQHDLQVPSGMPLPDGNEVRVGAFEDGFDVGAHSSDLTSLLEAWQEFGRTAVRTLSGQGGRVSATLMGDAQGFASKKLYVWAFKTTSNGPVAIDMSNVEAYGLYAKASAWSFPSASLPPFNSVNIVSSDADTFFFGMGNESSLFLEANPTEPQALTYAQWQGQVFTEATPIERRDPGDNPDGDELSNGMEYLTGSDPERSETSPFDSAVSGTSFTLIFPRPKAIPAGVEIIETSDDLDGWREATEAMVEHTPLDAMSDRIRITFRAETASRVFLRIRLKSD